MLCNATCWSDVSGAPIQAHGGWILPVAEADGTEAYYWYGEDYVRGGFACYRSHDLVSWEDLGTVFAAGAAEVMERPRVLRSPETGRYVLWFHADDAHYQRACVGVAEADTPEGPFELMRVMKPNGFESRDFTLFQDEDGTSWLIHSSDANKTLRVAHLRPNLLDLSGRETRACIDQEREAPCVLAANGQYYLLTSGCSGWRPNAALFARAERVLGPWKLVDNPCDGPDSHTTFGGQATCLFVAAGKPYVLIDHWKREDLAASGYTILPVTFRDEKHDPLEISWADEFLGI